VNVCHDQRRGTRDLIPAEDAAELAARGPDPQQQLADVERRRALEVCLRRLPPKERAALVLRDLEGLSTGEVAAALGSSEATVRSQISKARVKVKKLMAEYFRRSA